MTTQRQKRRIKVLKMEAENYAPQRQAQNNGGAKDNRFHKRVKAQS